MNRLSIMKRSYFELFKIAWNQERLYYLYILLNFVFVCVNSYVIIQIPKTVLDILLGNNANFGKLIEILSVLILSGLGISVCRCFYTPVGFRLKYKVLHSINKKNLFLPISIFESPKILDNLKNISEPAEAVYGIQWFYLNVAELSGNIAIIFISIGVLFKVNLILVILIIGWIFVYSYLMILVSEKTDIANNDVNKDYRKSDYLRDICMEPTFNRELRIHSLKKWFFQKLNSIIKILEVHLSKVHSFTSRITIYNDIFQFIRDFVMYTSLVIMFVNNKISISDFSIYGILIMNFNSALSASMENVKKITKGYTRYFQMFDYLEMENENHEGISIASLENWEIQFENVSFKYPNSEVYVYENLNYSIKKGKKIAIIGLNGAGKTTLLKLLMRLYNPTKGRILFNGVDIKGYKLGEYYELFSPVFQEMNIFPYSIEENLLFGKKSEVDLMQVIEQVDLDGVLRNFPMSKKMTKNLDEDGLILSGGEIQKFMMARAVCSNREVLILDEPTSAFDSLAEYDFYNKVNTTYIDKTIIFVSHRLASTRFCDEIILIDNKNITEKGTHEELITKQGKYYELFETQSKYYKEEELK